MGLNLEMGDREIHETHRAASSHERSVAGTQRGESPEEQDQESHGYEECAEGQEGGPEDGGQDHNGPEGVEYPLGTLHRRLKYFLLLSDTRVADHFESAYLKPPEGQRAQGKEDTCSRNAEIERKLLPEGRRADRSYLAESEEGEPREESGGLALGEPRFFLRGCLSFLSCLYSALHFFEKRLATRSERLEGSANFIFGQ